MTLDDINGLICINLWEKIPNDKNVTPQQLIWLDQLSQNLSQYSWHSIINASYHTKIDYSDPSIYNTLLHYNWRKYDADVMSELVKQCNNYVMSQHMIDRVFGPSTFALYSIDSFIKHYTTSVPHVKSWLVVGQAWIPCVHRKSIGLVNLCKVAEQLAIRIYGTLSGFLHLDIKSQCGYACFLNDSLITWTHIDNDIFQATIKTE